ncbi:MAG: type IV toxin-antitoxin system AbiEi family antitoxin domain-containing protein [Solirubrobacterales bacterium]
MGNSRAFDPDSPGESHYRSGGPHPDEVVAGFARRQFGVVSRAQLLAAGLSRHEIDDRVASGHLRPEHRGVYSVGHRSGGWPGIWMAAVLSCGTDSALFRLSAGAHFGLIRGRPQAIEIVAPRVLRPRGTIRPHRSRLPPDELTVHEGIPATTVARTLLDLAAVLGPPALERAVNEAEVQRLTSPTSLPSLLNRHPRRPGSAALRRILALESLGADVTLSELEDRLIALVDEAGLPRPRTNALIPLAAGPIVPDCLWPEQRVVLELDGDRFHGTALRRRDDRARDRELAAAGYLPIRAGWFDLTAGRAAFVASLRAILESAPRQ